LPELADDAELLTSELVTNACRAATDVITVVLLRDKGGFVVRVTDDDDTPVSTPAAAPHDDALTGRGLHLVDKIASDWGAIRNDAHGKTVWFRLNISPSGTW
jgi:anti-sigma regulatory factor (Ser/Thr protein kinase)